MPTTKLQVSKIAESKGIKNPNVLAVKTGLGYAICYRLWHEDQQRIDLKTISALCEAMKVLPGDLFDYQDK